MTPIHTGANLDKYRQTKQKTLFTTTSHGREIITCSTHIRFIIKKVQIYIGRPTVNQIKSHNYL